MQITACGPTQDASPAACCVLSGRLPAKQPANSSAALNPAVYAAGTCRAADQMRSSVTCLALGTVVCHRREVSQQVLAAALLVHVCSTGESTGGGTM